MVDGAVEKARQEVITCLRVNDRRPLDCWREVEDFKREVGRLRAEISREGDGVGGTKVVVQCLTLYKHKIAY